MLLSEACLIHPLYLLEERQPTHEPLSRHLLDVSKFMWLNQAC
jgi:hypothetical protein